MTGRSTGIEWTEHTWNPFVGCSVHSAGCTNCYATRLARRIEAFGTTPAYEGTTRTVNGRPVWTGRINRGSAATWRKPFKVREPSMFFVNSMSDFFHEAAPDAWRVEALDVMRATPRHAYQVLTKRPENIAPFLERAGVELPSNVWIGVTIERGDFAFRLDILREVPAAIRFVSAEPLIGPLGRVDLDGIHWIITGGESGTGARPMEAAWLREIRDQCIEQDVPHFLKQWGKPQNNPLYAEAVAAGHRNPVRYVERLDPVGKGGSTLDGREWKQFPASTTR